MAGKRGKKKSSAGSTISVGLLPSAAFTVVPRTPAPSTPPGTNLDLASSSRVLNSSLLAKMTGNFADDDDPFSDPESSLYDYQVMEEAGYSSVEFAASSGKKKNRISYSLREPAPIPSLAANEHAVDDDGDRFYHILEKQPTPQEIEALYAKPQKKTKRRSVGDEATLQQTGQRVQEAYREVQQMASDSDEVQEEMITEVKVKAEKHEPNLTVPTMRQAASSPRPPSPALNSRRSGHISGSNTARSISEIHTARSENHTARSVDPSIRNLEGENTILRSLNESLVEEVHTFKRVTSELDKGDRDTAANLLLKKQLHDMKDENETLKKAVHRLSVELSDYQTKYRKPTGEERSSSLLGVPGDGPVPSWLINTKYLAPLFLAYDDRLDEKEKLVGRYQLELEQLRIQGEHIVTENQQLQEKLEKLQTEGPVDLHEWENLKENARLVLEENQNLLEQIEIKDQKAHDMSEAHVQEVSKVSKQLVLIRTERSEIETEVDTWRMKYKDMKNKYETLSMEVGDKKLIEDYINMNSELKKEKATLEDAHRHEIENLKTKLQAAQMEMKNNKVNMIEVTTENKRCQAEIRAMRKAIRKAQSKMIYLQRAIEQSENKEVSVQEHMASLIKVAEKTAYERDTYAKVAKEQETETKKALNRVRADNLSKGKLEEKLKLYKMKAAAKMNTVAVRLKEQDQAFSSQKQEYEWEIKHLRHLLKEKEHVLNSIAKDKKDIEEDLEIVWNAATSENDRMKNVLHKTMKKLRQHEHLSEAMDALEPMPKTYVSSDDQEE